MPAPLLASRARFSGARLLFGTMQLHPDALVFTGWSWYGRIRHRVALRDVTSVAWWDGDSAWNLVIACRGHERLLVHVRGAGRWKFAIEEQVRLAVLGAVGAGPAPPPAPER